MSGAHSVRYADLPRVWRSAPQMGVRRDVDVPRDLPALGWRRDRLGVSLHGDVPMEARLQCVAGHMKHVPAVIGPRSKAPEQITLVAPSGPAPVNLVEATPFSWSVQVSMPAPEDVKRKTSRIVTVLTSGILAPRFVGIETARYAGRFRWKPCGVGLVAHERSEVYRPLGPARPTGPWQDRRLSGEQHSDPGPVRAAIQVHGILSGQKLQWTPIDTLLDAALLLQSPSAVAALLSKAIADPRSLRAALVREDTPDLMVHETYNFTRRRTEEGIWTLSSSSMDIERTHAMSLRLNSSSGLRLAPCNVLNRSGGTGSPCASNQALR